MTGTSTSTHIAAQTRLLRGLDRSATSPRMRGSRRRSWHPGAESTRTTRSSSARSWSPSSAACPARTDRRHHGAQRRRQLHLRLPERLRRTPGLRHPHRLLDANYSYSDAERHGEKLLKWLSGGTARRLVVLAYDDREIMLNGRKVLRSGGTFRATERMHAFFEKRGAVSRADEGPVRLTRLPADRRSFSCTAIRRTASSIRCLWAR